MKRILFSLLVVLFLSSCSSNKVDLYKLVDPMIGTNAHGHTFPGATAPFGMVQLSPDTRLGTWDGCSGYHYSDTVIYGFSHTHLSGTGCSDYGDILLMPTTGNPTLSNSLNNGYPSSFRHNTEKAEAGYYSVILDNYNIKVELTATERVGFHKYTFPDKTGNIIIDLKHRDDVIASSIEVVNDTLIRGYRRSRAWADDQYVYFVACFSQPFSNYGIGNDKTVSTDAKTAEGTDIKAYISFDDIQEPIIVTVAISGVSVENATKNLVHIGDFNTALAETQQKWNENLGKIKIQSIDVNDDKVFYTALYHSMIAPNIYDDKDKQYRGRDLQIHTADNFDNYTVFSLWDTYRAANPLLSLIDKKRTNDFINTFLVQYQQGGTLPVWELSANETGCMIGYHSIPVIYDAYMKGIRDFDAKLALEAMKHSAELDHLGLKYYKTFGYIASDAEGESVSKTIEYAYDDWCIAMFAKELGDKKTYTEYIKRSQSYKNLFDANTGFFRAKVSNLWFTPFDPTEVNFNYTEANSWQYNFYVPQDVNTHISMLGGDEKYAAKLDELFNSSSKMTGRVQSDITGLIGQYAHGNEPSHHVAYLYNYVGEAWKSQKLVRQIMKDFYYDAPDGLCGNEDCGQMSAWYVFSALGFYPVCPGDGKFIIGSPIVKNAIIKLENGKEFSILSKNQSEKNIYIDKMTLNGKDYTKSYITYDDIFDGGEIIFYMTDKANEDFGKSIEDRPVNIIEDNLIVAVPYFSNEVTTFNDKISITINTPVAGNEIYYTINGSKPGKSAIKYNAPFEITETTTVQAICMDQDKNISKSIETTFTKVPKNRSIQLLSKYENQYSAGGENALIDFIKGGENFKTGAWQGYQGQDFAAIVDLGKVESINHVSAGFIQDTRSWIFFPTKVEVYTSVDGNKYVLFGEVNQTESIKDEIVKVQEMGIEGRKSKARYVKVIAKSIMTCPDWHLGAGNPAWLFIDEITIN